MCQQIQERHGLMPERTAKPKQPKDDLRYQPTTVDLEKD